MHWAIPLVASIAAPVVAGSAVGALTTSDRARAEYARTRKPSWSPPGWVFGVVWPVLYALMGIAAWLVWRAPSSGGGAGGAGGAEAKRWALQLYAIQLAINLAWSFVYFGLGARGAALVVLLALDALVLATALAFARVDPRAAGLLVPYIAWLAVATALNASVVALG